MALPQNRPNTCEKKPFTFSARKLPPIAESSGVQQQLASAKRKRIMFPHHTRHPILGRLPPQALSNQDFW
jgi:hypothetical protein